MRNINNSRAYKPRNKISRLFLTYIANLVFLLCGLHRTEVSAAENGFSFYVPGLYGDIAIAVPPAPGTYLLSTSVYYSAKAPESLFPNEIDQNINADVFAQLLRGFWVPQEKFLGAQVLTGFRMSLMNTDISVDFKPDTGLPPLSDQKVGFGDFAILPLSLYWQYDDIYINLYQVVSIPTGKYDQSRLANVALHHWVFNTVLAFTWLDPKTGIEISATPGIIFNTENKATNYQSGIEFHMDMMLNWRLSSSLTMGLHGSIYQQLTADKGADPSIGDFKGQGYSLGPALIWNKTINEQTYYASAKWLHEFGAKNKAEGDLMIFSAGIKF